MIMAIPAKYDTPYYGRFPRRGYRGYGQNTQKTPDISLTKTAIPPFTPLPTTPALPAMPWYEKPILGLQTKWWLVAGGAALLLTTLIISTGNGYEEAPLDRGYAPSIVAIK